MCGRPNLPMSAALEECDNPRGMTQEEALLQALKGVPEDE